jgi:ubiquinone/menaquinone biosynthesis C-methylase UbiE
MPSIDTMQPTLEDIAAQLRKPNGELGLNTAVAMNQSNEHLTSLTVDALNIQKHDHILEIGMANGKFVQNIFSKFPGVKYTGCDYSELMVKEAMQLNRHLINSGNVSFVHADAHRMPFADDQFHKIFLVNVLYFWEQPEKELAEIRRGLKTGGRISIGIRSRSTMLQLPFVYFGFRLYEMEDVVQLLNANHFNVVSTVEEDEPHVVQGNEIILRNIIVAAEKS